MRYQHIFFDLDRTIWDFDRNSKDTLLELFEALQLSERTDHAPMEFVRAYQQVNERLWSQYRAGTIQKEELRSTRFRVAFREMEIDDPEFADQFGEEYLRICPLKTKLVDGAEEVLGLLHEKFVMHLITNGFHETQAIKIRSAAIGHYFDEVITSEAAGARKPSRKIFELAFNKTGSRPEHSLMIGDDHEADIEGAQRVGMDQIHYAIQEEVHRLSEATYVIRDLREIGEILAV